MGCGSPHRAAVLDDDREVHAGVERGDDLPQQQAPGMLGHLFGHGLAHHDEPGAWAVHVSFPSSTR